MYQQHLEDQYDEAMQREAYEQAMAEEAAYEDDEVCFACTPNSQQGSLNEMFSVFLLAVV